MLLCGLVKRPINSYNAAWWIYTAGVVCYSGRHLHGYYPADSVFFQYYE